MQENKEKQSGYNLIWDNRGSTFNSIKTSV